MPPALTDFLGRVSLLEVVLSLIAIGFVIGFIRKGWPALVKFIKLVDLLQGLIGWVAEVDAKLGKLDTLTTNIAELKDDVAAVKTDVSNVKTDVSGVKTTVDDVRHQVYPNSGKSFRDAVDHLRQEVDSNKETLEGHIKDSKKAFDIMLGDRIKEAGQNDSE